MFSNIFKASLSLLGFAVMTVSCSVPSASPKVEDSQKDNASLLMPSNETIASVQENFYLSDYALSNPTCKSAESAMHTLGFNKTAWGSGNVVVGNYIFNHYIFELPWEKTIASAEFTVPIQGLKTFSGYLGMAQEPKNPNVKGNFKGTISIRTNQTQPWVEKWSGSINNTSQAAALLPFNIVLNEGSFFIKLEIRSYENGNDNAVWINPYLSFDTSLAPAEKDWEINK